MAITPEFTKPVPVNDNDIDDEFQKDDEEDEEETEPSFVETRHSQTQKLKILFNRIQNEAVRVRVHDVIVRGNTKTKDSFIESQISVLRDVQTMQELLEASRLASFRLKSLGIFDSVKMILDAGPAELSGTANVVVEVVEAKSPLTGEIGAYTRGEARSSTVEATIKLKNIFGYGDLWDGSLAYGGDHMTEVSTGVYLPSFKGLETPVTARLFLVSQDWLKFSSFKERSLGASLGLFSNINHDLSYSLAWRTLTDPSQMASKTVRRQLGHGLLSSLKYTFKIDRRNSSLRPTNGYAFASTTQVAGLVPDWRSLRFLRQEFDLRYAVPLGFYRSAVNFGISAGVIFPWGPGFSNMPSPLPERFYLGGNLSPICNIGGPIALWGFRTRGLGPTESRRQMQSNQSDENADSGRDYVGGDLAVTAFADLSFDFPFNWCRDKGIHGHAFASAGNATQLTENAYRNFSLQKFAESFRSTVGVGIVFPTNLFRLELNYCYTLKKLEHDQGKSGFKISFSTPS